MSRLGMMAHMQMAVLAAMMDRPSAQHVVVIDSPKIPDIGADEVFAFYGDSSGAFRSTNAPHRERPAIYKPNGAREVERRRRQREKREARRISTSD